MPERPNHLYYGDNLTILRDRIDTASVDLIYLDPPFNSNATYNVLFRSHDGESSPAQIEAFDDTWHWSQQTEELLDHLVGGGAPPKVADAMAGLRNLLGTSDVNAYLVMMTARLVELHRVLKPTGSLYLHCDATASHYLKVVLDAIFGPENFRNEVIWKRTNARSASSNQWSRVHDVLLFYGRSSKAFFQPLKVAGEKAKLPHTLITGADGNRYQTYELTGAGTRKGETGKPWRGFDPDAMGRHWGNLHAVMDGWDAEGLIHWPKKNGFPRRRAAEPFVEEDRMVPVGDVWTDIDRINQAAKERLGYPTQKPLALLERIIEASSSEGDVVLDPFCGCGTTIDASEKLRRRWVGIDVTYLAVDLIRNRLRHTYGYDIEQSYEVHGVPSDLDGARALFADNPFDFERWVVSLIDGTPNEKQVGDRGIDGRVRFHADENRIGQILVSVKGGQTMNPAMVRDLIGTVQREKAEMGILITLKKPTPGMIEEVKKSGSYVAPLTRQTYPKVQIVTTADLLARKRPIMPTPILPYINAKARNQGEQLTLG